MARSFEAARQRFVKAGRLMEIAGGYRRSFVRARLPMTSLSCAAASLSATVRAPGFPRLRLAPSSAPNHRKASSRSSRGHISISREAGAVPRTPRTLRTDGVPRITVPTKPSVRHQKWCSPCSLNYTVDLGMHVPQANGIMTSETLQALIDFQKWAGLPGRGN